MPYTVDSLRRATDAQTHSVIKREPWSQRSCKRTSIASNTPNPTTPYLLNSPVLHSPAASSSSTSSDESLQGKRKRLGRKPDQHEPASRRAAQNRVAQRAYRERRERHVRDLEAQLATLQAAMPDDLVALRERVTVLEAENVRLRVDVEGWTEGILPRTGCFVSIASKGIGLEQQFTSAMKPYSLSPMELTPNAPLDELGLEYLV
ncbi:hypothetical protein BC830DRAFT_1082547 [Chytriomyces sp. MP71]|nr:hypothetical protein BC830DRAFT_1082547 [Chytriomyces sp. MP71]